MYHFFFSKKAILKRQFKKSSIKQISAFKNGDVGKVIGTIQNITDPLLTPFTQKKCVYYEIKVIDTSSKEEKVLISEEKIKDFHLINYSGKALLKVRTASMDITKDINYASGYFNKPTEAMKAFLIKNNINPKTVIKTRKSLRFVEKSLSIGERVGIYGQGFLEVPLNKYDEYDTREILTFKSLESQALYVTDNPKKLEQNHFKS
ncbi:hypothetical protein [Urechidicola croceus]|nr:hypothetical protein [Urechidicola croceus]